jgi:hypothetical protein
VTLSGDCHSLSIHVYIAIKLSVGVHSRLNGRDLLGDMQRNLQ